MIIAPIPVNEEQRLASLRQYELLDTLPEIEYDRVTHIASELCQAPIAMVSFIDEHRQWVKSHYGIEISEIPRNISLCAHTINGNQLMLVEDTTKDERFRNNPAVVGQPGLIFYAGIPLVSSDGYAIGTICVIDHEPRQLRQAQKMALTALAQQVVLLMELHRTNTQLTQARQQAEDLAKQKAHLLATLSHEIRTPLHALQGYTQQLVDGQPRPDQADGVKRVHQVGRTLVGLVNNILDYSKIQAGKMLLEDLTFSLPELVQQAADMLNGQAEHKAIGLVVTKDAALPPLLRGDATRLLQVLTNLLSNAIKFTKHGEVSIGARLVAINAGQAQVEIGVTDTGIGIPEQSLAQLFNEYTQVSASTTRLYGGTGLGLAITHQLLELMGSRLEVSSQVGVGTRFWFQLDLPIAASVSTALKPSSAKPLENRLFLAVDDHIANTKLLTYVLGRQGAEVAVFNNPMDALAAAQHTRYQGILLDLFMPEMDGYELAKALQPLQPGIPLIALSGDDSPETLEKVKAAGFSGFLLKPYQPQQLISLLTGVQA